MTRINTNVSSLIGQRVLGHNNAGLSTSLERLSTGLRINRGKDDPAGLIASENLRADIAGLGQAVKNAERADQVVNIAEGGLTEISALLTELQSLVTQSANTGGLSREELDANQLQIDSVLQTIDRLAGATSFQGMKLLNGNFDYQTTDVSSVVSDFQVNGAKLGFQETRDVDVVITESAQVGGFLLSFGAANLDLTNAQSEFKIEIAGVDGARELTFSSGTSLGTIVDTINSFTPVTGVKATLSGTDAIKIETDEFGSDQFVSVKVTDDGGLADPGNAGLYELDAGNAEAADASGHTDFNALANAARDDGQDVQGTINGIRGTSRGTQLAIATDFLDVSLDLAYDLSGPAAPNAGKLGAFTAFTIEGGGGDFMLASRVTIGGKVAIGVGNVAARELGRSIVESGGSNQEFTLADLATGNSLDVTSGDINAAQVVVEKAIKDVSSLRGRLGAFQKNVIGASINSLGVSLENSKAAESVIRDTDFATESAELTRSQILVSSSTQVLGIANQQPNAALQLLG